MSLKGLCNLLGLEYWKEKSNEDRFEVVGKEAYDFYDLYLSKMLDNFDSFDEFWDKCGRIIKLYMLEVYKSDKLDEDLELSDLKELASEKELNGYKNSIKMKESTEDLIRIELDSDEEILYQILVRSELKMILKSYYQLLQLNQNKDLDEA